MTLLLSNYPQIPALASRIKFYPLVQTHKVGAGGYHTRDSGVSVPSTGTLRPALCRCPPGSQFGLSHLGPQGRRQKVCCSRHSNPSIHCLCLLSHHMPPSAGVLGSLGAAVAVLVLCPCPQADLTRSALGLEPGPQRVKVSILGNPDFPTEEMELWVPRLLCALSATLLLCPEFPLRNIA